MKEYVVIDERNGSLVRDYSDIEEANNFVDAFNSEGCIFQVYAKLGSGLEAHNKKLIEELTSRFSDGETSIGIKPLLEYLRAGYNK